MRLTAISKRTISISDGFGLLHGERFKLDGWYIFYVSWDMFILAISYF